MVVDFNPAISFKSDTNLIANNQESKICNVVIFHSKWLISFVNGCLFNNSIKTTFSKVDKSSIFAFKRRVK